MDSVVASGTLGGDRPLGEQDSGRPSRGADRAAPGRRRTAGRVCECMCILSHMATNLSLDPALLERALALSGERTKKAAVTRALQEFIARREQRRLLPLFRSLEWDTKYDYKAERSRS